MDDEKALICQACGTRNKPSWEFCARCAEPLEITAAPVDDRVAVPPAEEVGAVVDDASSSLDETEETPVAHPSDFRLRHRVEDEPPPPSPVGSVAWGFVLVAIAIATVGVLWWAARVDQPASQKSMLSLAVTPQVGPRPAAASHDLDKFIEGRAHLWRGDSAGALPLLAESVAEKPDSALYHFTYGQALWDLERWDDSVAQVREAARLSPELYAGMLPHALAAAHRVPEALREYDLAANAQPGNAALVREYAQLLTSTANHQAAQRVLRRAIELRPQDSELRSALGAALEAGEEPAAALGIYRGLLAEDGTRVDVRARLAHLLVAQGEPDEARGLYLEGLRLNPRAASLHSGLAELLESGGDLKQAATHYREAARLSLAAAQAEALVAHAGDLERRAAGGAIS